MIKWKFKAFLAEKRQIYSGADLQKRIAKRTGVAISLAHLCKLLNGRPPAMLRLSTIEVICTGLECELGDFLQVSPKAMNPENVKKLSFKNVPKSKISGASFPNPNDYES